VVYAPAHGLLSDGFPGEEGQAQERSWCGAVLETVQADELWRQERHCCPWAFRCESDRRGAGFITRPPAGRPWEIVKVRRSVGRIATGHVAEPRVQVWAAQGDVHLLRRIRVTRAQATRDGDRGLSLLTNVPLRKASATRVARLDRQRWTLATACQHLAADCPAAMHPFGSPQAAWFGCGLALVAYNR
jgi:hypothetical protein